MIETKSFKSAEAFTNESKVAEVLQAAAERWAKAHPLAAQEPSQQTEIKLGPSGGILVAKRTIANAIVANAALPSVAEMEKLAGDRGFEWSAESAGRVIPYWASDDRVDRHGDRVEQSWDMGEYEINPIVLFSHNWHMPPIGGNLSWGVEPREDKSFKGEGLRLLTLFATKDQYPWADTLFRLSKAGFMPSGSVGFYPGEVIRIKDKEEREKLGLGEDGFIFRQNKLIEWSPCSVPANVGAHKALVRAKSMGLLNPNDVQALRELRRREVEELPDAEKRWKTDDTFLRGMWQMLHPGTKIPEHRDVEEPIAMDETVSTATVVRGAEVTNANVLEAVESMTREFGERLVSLEQQVSDIRSMLDGENPAANREEEEGGEEEESADVIVGLAAQLLAEDPAA
jgi:hypothetical protein